jgi:hypothetical protein
MKKAPEHLDLSHEQATPESDVRFERLKIRVGLSGIRLDLQGAAVGLPAMALTLGWIAYLAGITGFPVLIICLLGMIIHGIVLIKVERERTRSALDLKKGRKQSTTHTSIKSAARRRRH